MKIMGYRQILFHPERFFFILNEYTKRKRRTVCNKHFTLSTYYSELWILKQHHCICFSGTTASKNDLINFHCGRGGPISISFLIRTSGISQTRLCGYEAHKKWKPWLFEQQSPSLTHHFCNIWLVWCDIWLLMILISNRAMMMHTENDCYSRDEEANLF